MTIQSQNRVMGDKRTTAYSNESDLHVQGKEIVLEYLRNGLGIFDQFGDKVSIKGDFYATESPVTKEHGKYIPFTGNTCIECFSNYKLIEHSDENNIENIHKLRLRTGYKNHEISENEYTLHPCIKCPFNKLNYRMVFDIGIGINGLYVAGIEILNSSRVKDYKLKYCIDNNIELIEIKVENIEKYKTQKDQLRCIRLWWKDASGKIHIADEYNK